MKVMIAGGGTGGHIFPALAVAEELRRRDASSEILFVGAEKGLEKKVVPAAGYPLRTLPVTGFKGVGLNAKLKSLYALPSSLWNARRCIGEFNPDVVLGVGGYASGPTVLMGALSGRPTVLFEANAEPGLANRLLAPLVRRAAVTYESTTKRFGSKAVRTGSPVRKEFFAVAAKSHRSPFTLLVFGGSRGAQAINRAVVDMLDFLPAGSPAVHFVHQTGERDLDAVRVAYAKKEIRAEVLAFIEDMPNRLAAADLVICRAGASTVAELAASGRAAILIPFPHATDQHQLRNAEVLARAGAAQLLPQAELSGERLAREILNLLQTLDRLTAMEEAARQLAVPDATVRIADIVESVAR